MKQDSESPALGRAELGNRARSGRPVYQSRFHPARIANHSAPALVLSAPFISFLRYNNYDLWRPESLLCIAFFVALGLLASGVIALRPDALRPIVIALILVFYVDVQFRSASTERIALLLEWPLLWKYKGMVVIGLALMLLLFLSSLTWLFRRHLGVIVSTFFGVFLVASILLPVGGLPNGETLDRIGPVRADLPPVVHLVLDGQIGLDGLPRDIPGSQELRRELEAFYERFGFTVFGGAFSHYSATFESLSNLVNGQAVARSGAHIATADTRVPQNGIRFRDNAWFRALSDRGYRIRIYGTDYLDFCSSDSATSIDYCFVAPSNSIFSLMKTDLPPTIKTSMILAPYLAGSLISRIAVKVWRSFVQPEGLWKDPQHLFPGKRLGAISASSVFDRITADLRAAPRGTAFFGHLLIPHGAYVFDPECRLKPNPMDWLGPTVNNAPPPLSNTPASREKRYMVYFDQVRCAHHKLSILFRAMEDAGVFADATIIVHGDHGSRIALRKTNIGSPALLSDADIVDNFSTLFAVRMPGPVPNHDRSLRSIQSLFAELLLERPIADEVENVFLDSAKDRKIGRRFIARPMPDFEN